MKNFVLNQKVTRKELTSVLCEKEINSGLITSEKPLMQVSIIDAYFKQYTRGKFIIHWLDEEFMNGIVKEMPSFTEENKEYVKSLGKEDTSDYEE